MNATNKSFDASNDQMVSPNSNISNPHSIYKPYNRINSANACVDAVSVNPPRDEAKAQPYTKSRSPNRRMIKSDQWTYVRDYTRCFGLRPRESPHPADAYLMKYCVWDEFWSRRERLRWANFTAQHMDMQTSNCR